MNAALSALCLRRLGFDPATLSQAELAERLPLMVEAVYAENESINRQMELVQKAALIVVGASTLIPNPGIVRDETVSFDHSERDPNSVLTSIIPFAE